MPLPILFSIQFKRKINDGLKWKTWFTWFTSFSFLLFLLQSNNKKSHFFSSFSFPYFSLSIFTTTNPVVSLEKKGSLLVSFSLIALIYILFLDFLMNDFFFFWVYIYTDSVKVHKLLVFLKKIKSYCNFY